MDSCRIQPFLENTLLRFGCERSFADLRPLSEQHLGQLGECGESENALFVSFPSPSIVWALTPAVEASFHDAASALSAVERPGSRSPAWALSQGSDASRRYIAQRTNKLPARCRAHIGR